MNAQFDPNPTRKESSLSNQDVETTNSQTIAPEYPPKGNMLESDKKAESLIESYRPAL